MNNKYFPIVTSAVIVLVVGAIVMSLFGRTRNATVNNPVVSTSTQATTTATSQTSSTSSSTSSPSWPKRPLSVEYITDLPNSIVVVGPKGKRVGRDSTTGVEYREIQGAYTDEQRTSLGVYLPSPSAGKYTINVIGGGTGKYGLQLDLYDGAGSLPLPIIRGTIQPGTVVTYVQNYNPNNLASSTLNYQGTASSTKSFTSTPPNNVPLPILPPDAPPPAPPAPTPPPPAPSSTEELAPPVISNLSTAVASTSITVSWTTNRPTTSQLLFGSSTAMLANIPPDTSFVTSHSLKVSGLVPNTTYYYQVKSKDTSGNIGSSAQQSFTTPGQ